MNTFMAPRQLLKLRLLHDARNTTTLSLNEQAMYQSRDRWKRKILARYFNHLAPVGKHDVLVVSITWFNLELGLPWFQAWNPEIDYLCNHLVLLCSPCVLRSHGFLDSQLGWPERNGVTIETISAAELDHLLSCEEVASACTLWIEDWIGLLEATLEKTDKISEYPCILEVQVGVLGVLSNQCNGT
jgi:hypothetical protein